MKKSKTADIPVLEEVVVPGSVNFSTEDDDAPLVLTSDQAQNLEQQIEKIVQARLQAVFDKAIQTAVKDIKAYLAKELPQILATTQQVNTDKKS